VTAVPRFRSHQGWPLFGNGFRPFFLFGSIYAGLAILVWLPVFHGEITLTSAFAPRDWHVHEMLYGYLPAVITGFLFTAIPNWTGRLPIQGTPLLVLAIIVAALSRICAVIEPAHSEPLLHLAAFAWAAAFFGFAITYGPLLAGARRRKSEPKLAA
jgi:uncharacterized protein involved in response to NO